MPKAERALGKHKACIPLYIRQTKQLYKDSIIK